MIWHQMRPYPFANKLGGIFWMWLTTSNESFKINFLYGYNNWGRYFPTG